MATSIVKISFSVLFCAFVFSQFIPIMYIQRKKISVKSTAQRFEQKLSLVGPLSKFCMTHPPSIYSIQDVRRYS